MALIKYGNHVIEVRFELNAVKTVLYDGEVMSSKQGIFGGTYTFCVKEEGQDAVYDVKVTPRGGLLGVLSGVGASLQRVEVFRNGKKIYSS